MCLFIGQRVVCVDASYWEDRSHLKETLPEAGRIYTIRAIGDAELLYGLCGIGLLLEEIVNAERRYLCPRGRVLCELCFRSDRFRPVHTTSIDIFTKMLEPVKVREPELT